MEGGEALFRAEALEQPGPCQGPVPLHTGVGYTERLGRFRDGQAPEIPQLYNPALLGIETRQFVERSIEREQIQTRSRLG